MKICLQAKNSFSYNIKILHFEGFLYIFENLENNINMSSITNFSKRIISIFAINVIIIFLLIFSIFKISTNKFLDSSQKNFYKLKVSPLRGTIYDCRGVPLIETTKKILASIIPNKSNFVPLLNSVSEEKKQEFIKKYFEKSPFIFELSKKVELKGVKIFEVLDQIFDSCLACHIIGYLKEENGVSGIEKSFNDHLKNVSNIETEYQKNASGKIISENNYNFNNKLYSSNHGIQLCIDKRIQEIAEKIGKKYIQKGAIVITEVPNCEIRASASFPEFSPSKIKYLLKSENSDLLNRVNCQYNLGSIFKLITAAYLLESGISKDQIYNCKGAFEFDDGVKIRCFDSKPHGKINLENAVSLSCNSMFADFSKNIDPDDFFKFVKKFKLGEKINIAPELISSPGNLPKLEELKDKKKMAMFSFGQGSLMVTPLQISGLVNSIASGGMYYEPRLVEKIINKDGSSESYHFSLPKKIFKFYTAKQLKNFMRSSIMYGTGKCGNPDNISAAGKTSTAETGMFMNGERINQSWFAGFFPFESPKYSIVVLCENTNLGGKKCGPVFKEIVEEISKFT